MVSLNMLMVIAGTGMLGMILATILYERQSRMPKIIGITLYVLFGAVYLVIARSIIFRLGVWWSCSDGAWEAGGIQWGEMLCPTADKFFIIAWFSLTLNCILLTKLLIRYLKKKKAEK